MKQRCLMFRAWDTRLKQMVETGFHIIGETTVFSMLEQHFKPMDGLGSLERLNDCVVMQYTGLQDKLGHDIYEGDILHLSFGTFPVTIETKHGLRTMWGKDNMCRGYADDGEVIGNIYENKDLLKG